MTSDGAFYVLQLTPDIAHGRVKLGWTRNLTSRLATHRCAAPTARLVKTWPCHRAWERRAINSLAESGCRKLSLEVFDVEDLATLVSRADDFFKVQPATTLQPRVPRRLFPMTRLRFWRERRALTQKELAARASLSRVALMRIEAGQAEPRPTTVRRLAEALNVQVEDLMDPLP